jgi:shikimate dehydrogenase
MIRAAVLGADVSRSRSPAIHGAAYRALGLEGSYQAFSVDPARFATVVKELGEAGYDYLNVTIPFKREAAELADRAAPVVRAMAAANTLIFGGRGKRRTIRAENTDGYGLLSALADLGIRVGPRQLFVLVGAGGAAAGGLAALVGAGARVRLVARRPAAARALRTRFPERARQRIEVAPWTAARLEQALDGATALVSAVPAAAWAEPAAAAGLDGLTRSTAVLEMAYGEPTPLAGLARQRSTRYQDGLPMLVHQAARAIQLVVGRLPPTTPLLRAARSARPSVKPGGRVITRQSGKPAGAPGKALRPAPRARAERPSRASR